MFFLFFFSTFENRRKNHQQKEDSTSILEQLYKSVSFNEHVQRPTAARARS